MHDVDFVESGTMGRVAYARIAPNEDLIQGVQKLCVAQGFKNAFVRGALGSLVDACLARQDGSWQQIKGPAVEIVSLAGEIRSQTDGFLQHLTRAGRLLHLAPRPDERQRGLF